MSRLLITGATGHLGRQLADHFRAMKHDVVEMGTRPHHPGVTVADLSRWDGAWVRHFAGVDCVLHLAACPRPDAGWNEIQASNLDLTANVFEAAAQRGVGRVVFASSNWVVAGHRFDDAWLNSAVEPAPVNGYGMSRLAGERLGWRPRHAVQPARLLYKAADVPGHPDGAAVDVEGGYWFASAYGWCVVRLDPIGRLDRVVEVPLQKPTKIAFGGPDLDTLFVTSIGTNLEPGSSDRQPFAGGLYAIDAKVRGTPPHRYAG